ncbi:hypothetical protein [Thiolapillus sp.]
MHPFLLLILLLLVSLSVQAEPVSGILSRQDTGQPIGNAWVSAQGMFSRVQTAADGSFSLDLPPAASGITLVGAAKGFYSSSITSGSPASNLSISLAPVPQQDSPAYHLLEPGNCASFCHTEQLSQWQDSPMAKAGLNTWVHDIYDGSGTPGGMGGFVYVRDSIHASSNLNSECASCHQPQHWLENPDTALLNPPGIPPSGVAHGVSCEICHKIANVDENRINFPGLYPGAISMTRPAQTGQQIQYGVLRDVSFNIPGTMEPSYQPQLVAEVCGACHQDKNDIHENGQFDGITSEPTYTEWAESPYGDPSSPQYQTCVDCHMPAVSNGRVCQAITPPPRDPDAVRSHRILGTTSEYLENAVELTLDARIINGELIVDADIYNHATGHHVPTGVTIRNMILLVEAWDADNGGPEQSLEYIGTQRVHELGGVGNPEQGYYASLPGKFFAKINHDASGNGPTFFTDATGITSDTRIPALSHDLSQYRYRVPTGVRQVQVRARLIYRRSFRFLLDAKGWQEDGHGQPLADVTAPYYGQLMEEQSQLVPNPASTASSIPSLSRNALLGLALLLMSTGMLYRWRKHH